MKIEKVEKLWGKKFRSSEKCCKNLRTCRKRVETNTYRKMGFPEKIPGVDLFLESQEIARQKLIDFNIKKNLTRRSCQ